jgi:hypothetical protein
VTPTAPVTAAIDFNPPLSVKYVFKENNIFQTHSVLNWNKNKNKI